MTGQVGWITEYRASSNEAALFQVEEPFKLLVGIASIQECDLRRRPVVPSHREAFSRICRAVL